jgi:hypothetical protein
MVFRSFVRSLVVAAAVAGVVALVPSITPRGVARAQDNPPKADDPPKKDAPDDKKPDDKKPDDAKKDDKKEGPDEGKLLEKKCHVPTGWDAAKHSVNLTYDFSDLVMKQDWKFDGLDRAVVGSEATSKHMELAVSTGGKGSAMLDSFDLTGDFTVTFSLKITYRAPSSSFFLVVGGKNGAAIGLLWGDQFVKVMKGGRLAPITKNDPTDTAFAVGKQVEVKVVRTGDDLQVTLAGEARPKVHFKKKELDGKVGLLLDTSLRVELTTLKVEGVIGKVKP